jgi:hypothetical protein
MRIYDDHPVEDLETPDESHSAQEVIELQVEALGSNDEPHKDAGIETAYNFASPSNRASTGPLSSFKRMVHNIMYKDMLNHKEANYGELDVRGDTAQQEVVLISEKGEETTFEFTLSKQKNGKWSGCWMTDGVIKKD